MFGINIQTPGKHYISLGIGLMVAAGIIFLNGLIFINEKIDKLNDQIAIVIQSQTISEDLSKLLILRAESISSMLHGILITSAVLFILGTILYVYGRYLWGKEEKSQP